MPAKNNSVNSRGTIFKEAEMSIQTAIDCFAENIRLFAPHPPSEPEKFNLYNGLVNLALAIQKMEMEINNIERDLHFIRNNLNR